MSAGLDLAGREATCERKRASSGSLAAVDVTGDGIADTAATLNAVGITDAERGAFATLDTPGQSGWRVVRQRGWDERHHLCL
jgi:hypothetical protein